MPFGADVVTKFVEQLAPGTPHDDRHKLAVEIEANVRAIVRGDLPLHDEWIADPLPRSSVGYNISDGAELVVFGLCYAALFIGVLLMWRQATRLRHRRLRSRWYSAAANLGLIPPPPRPTKG